MQLKRIGLILILLILLPAIFYTVYEFTSLNANERLMTELYDLQLSSMLTSVNQHAWDRVDDWASEFSSIVGTEHPPAMNELADLISSSGAVSGLFIADTNLTTLHIQTTTEVKADSVRLRDHIQQLFKENSALLQHLVRWKKTGYGKIEPLTWERDSDEEELVMLFVNRDPDDWRIIGMILDPNRYIRSVIVPALQGYAEQDVVFGIFQQGEPIPVFATGAIQLETVRHTRKLWLFPEHIMALHMGIDTLQEMARDRFQRTLLLVILMDAILILGAVLLYRNMQKTVELSRMKTDFVANVSHELRTPLALIRMYAETLELNRVRSNEQREEYARIITHETERLTHLINNILDFSKMEANLLKYHLVPLDLREVIDRVLDMYRFHLESRDFTLETRISSQSLMIAGDSDALVEILINLLENAMKFSSDKKNIAVEAGQKKQDIWMAIVDQGIGIPEREQQRIFEKFYRVASGPVHNTKGSGLGLSLVIHIMKAHGGRVEVESSPGRGSTFRLVFPAVNHVESTC